MVVLSPIVFSAVEDALEVSASAAHPPKIPTAATEAVPARAPFIKSLREIFFMLPLLIDIIIN